MVNECVILADGPGTLIELCGISTLERLLRTLQRCGIERATVLSSTPKAIAQELAAPSWARAQLHVTLRARPAGAVTIEQIVDNLARQPVATPLLLDCPGGFCFRSTRYCALWLHKIVRQPWLTPAWGHGFRPSSLPRQILPEGNYAVRLFWKMTGLQREAVPSSRFCAAV